MIIEELIAENSADFSGKLLICGEDPADEFDPYHTQYFEGTLSDVPEYLFKCEVLSVGRSLAKGCPVVAVPFLMNDRFYNPATLTGDELRAGITIEEKQRELMAYMNIMCSCDAIESSLRG